MATSAKTSNRNRWRRTSKPHELYNTYGKHGWRGKDGLRARHLYLQPFCVECLKEGKPLHDCTPDKPVVDHIKPHKGRKRLFFDDNNLQTLCASHHSAKTAATDSTFTG